MFKSMSCHMIKPSMSPTSVIGGRLRYLSIMKSLLSNSRISAAISFLLCMEAMTFNCRQSRVSHSCLFWVPRFFQKQIKRAFKAQGPQVLYESKQYGTKASTHTKGCRIAATQENLHTTLV